MKVTDEAMRREMLSQMGIENGSVDLNTYINSLKQELSEVMDINKALMKHISEAELDTEKKQQLLVKEIMSGLD